jgi:hypothetical protein
MRKIFAIFSNIKVDASGANAPFHPAGLTYGLKLAARGGPCPSGKAFSRAKAHCTFGVYGLAKQAAEKACTPVGKKRLRG